jgi:phosphoribosyl isomerase A
VTFDVIPALDVSDGRLVRWTGVGAASVDGPYHGDPLAAASAIRDAGARWVHLVDVDLALAGRRRLDALVGNVAALGLRVQASGGITAPDDVDAMLAAGADRVVLSSSILADAGAPEALFARLGEAVAAGVEVDGDEVRPRGRRDLTWPLAAALRRLADIGATRYVVTAVRRAGASSGPDLDAVRRLRDALAGPIIASGGIRSVDDLRAVASIGGVEAAIVGAAVVAGEMALEAALSERR